MSSLRLCDERDGERVLPCVCVALVFCCTLSIAVLGSWLLTSDLQLRRLSHGDVIVHLFVSFGRGELPAFLFYFVAQ